MLLDLSHGLLGSLTQGEGNPIVRRDSYYGISVVPGYEYMASSGFLARIGAGPAGPAGSVCVPGNAPGSRSGLNFTVAIGFKLF